MNPPDIHRSMRARMCNCEEEVMTNILASALYTTQLAMNRNTDTTEIKTKIVADLGFGVSVIFYCRYLLAILNANEGSITKTVASKSLINILLRVESGAFAPGPVMTTKIPIIPKTMDE